MMNDRAWWSGMVVAVAGLWVAKTLAAGNIHGFLTIVAGGAVIVWALWAWRNL